MISNIFDKVHELKDKFKKFLFHRKQLLALDNYSSVVPFQHKDYLILIKRCMADGFLGEQEADFLVHLTNKYFSEQNFLDWTHKTRWLKARIKELKEKQNEPPKSVQMDLFEMPKTQVPFELLAAQQRGNSRVSRRA